MCTFWSIQNAEQCFVLRCVCCCCLELTFYGLLKWRSAPAFKHSLQILRFIAAYPDWCCYYECINGWPLTIVYIALRFHYLCNVWLVERFIKLNKEDAVDRCKWRKVIKEARWSGWVWVGECFFWYQPTRVVPLFFSAVPFSSLTLLAESQKEHPARKNHVMRCRCGFLSGVRYRFFAYVRAHAIAIPKPHHFLPH